MIKKITLTGLLCGLVLASQAQTPELSASSTAVERQRIASERVRLEAGFSAEDAACYDKFLVNNCLDKVRVRRNEAMADLRRQEILLNDQDRRLKGAEQIRKTEEKSSPASQQEAANRRAEALSDFQGRAEREKQKSLDRADAAAGEKASGDAAAARLQENQNKATARSAKQAAAAEQTKKYQERQREAAERKARHDAEQLRQTKPPAASLPLPPS
jgi:colicin import membrane protein